MTRAVARVQLTLNGALRSVDAPPLARLLDVLRGPLGLTGTKEGCGEGECGSCTVLLDGEPVNACLVAIGQCAGRSVVTVEGLGSPAHLSPLQEAFVTEGGAQCGICTPGMLVAAEALLSHRAEPTEEEIREAVAGNICRCTGYQRIVDAVRKAGEVRRTAMTFSGATSLPGNEPPLLASAPLTPAEAWRRHLAETADPSRDPFQPGGHESWFAEVF